MRVCLCVCVRPPPKKKTTTATTANKQTNPDNLIVFTAHVELKLAREFLKIFAKRTFMHISEQFCFHVSI